MRPAKAIERAEESPLTHGLSAGLGIKRSKLLSSKATLVARILKDIGLERNLSSSAHILKCNWAILLLRKSILNLEKSKAVRR